MTEEEKQTTLGTFGEAEEKEQQNSRWFKAETNKVYTLTFTTVKEAPDPRHPHYKIMEKEIPDFNDKTKLVKKMVVILQVDSVNGKPVNQEWSIMPKALRGMVQLPCESSALLKKKYLLKTQGEGNKKTYSFVEAGDR
jgi:hypothetical protein